MVDTQAGGGASEGPTGADEPGGTLWMALGLAALGFAAGFTTGLSVHEGISSSLLSSIFSFVSGTLLSFSGFAYVLRSSGRLAISTRRLGLGVLGFALGITLGQPSGITVRVVGNQWATRCVTGSGWFGSCDVRREEAERKEQTTLQAEQRERARKVIEARAEREELARKLARAIDASGKVSGRDTVAILAAAAGLPAAEATATVDSFSVAKGDAARASTDKVATFAAQAAEGSLCREMTIYRESRDKDPATVLKIVDGMCRVP